MKKISFFLFILCYTFMLSQNYYIQQWKKIEDNSQKGLYKSNLPLIKDIQDRARNDQNTVQLIKALKAEFSVVLSTEDDPQNNAVSGFFERLQQEKENIRKSDRLFFRLMENEFVSEYYAGNSWKINRRTAMDEQNLKSVETWSRLDFRNYLRKEYAELDEQKKELRHISLTQYKEIFEGQPDFDYFPTLANWFAVQYIRFLNNDGLFTPNEKKANQTLINSIFNEEIDANAGNVKLYFQDKKLNANCDFSNCTDRAAQLENLFRSSVAGDYKVYIAWELMNELSSMQKFGEALEMASEARKQYSKSIFVTNIESAENQIRNPQLTLAYETAAQPGRPMQLVAEAKNVSKFSLRIYKADDRESFMKYVNENYNFPFSSVKKTFVRKDDFILPAKSDFKTYRTSVALKPLPAGMYMAEYWVGETMQKDFYFIVSDYRVVYMSRKGGKSDILRLADNETGRSPKNADLSVMSCSRGNKININSAKTDENGAFILPENSQNRNYLQNFLIQVNGKDQYVFWQNGSSYYSRVSGNNTSAKVQVFLDRAIYRPGQTVYFKVITTQLLNNKESVLAGEPLKITLSDANGQEVSVQNSITGNYGSCTGSFVLPKGRLNGNFSLQVDGKSADGYKSFLVEEYKRPNFEVTFDPVKEEYQYGQTIQLKGKAVSYSGVPLSNVEVQYEIKKQDIRWKYFWWFPQNYQENSVLGNATTNEKGEFTITLSLQKDEALKGIQVDNYQINASATDINGETQDAQTHLRVASVSHYIDAENIGNVFSDDDIRINVTTRNYNGQELKKNYHVTLEKLMEPERVFRDNFQNNIQNLPQMTKDEFVRMFPHDYFDKSDLRENWKTEKSVIGDALQNSMQQLNLGKLPAGTYRMLLLNREGQDTIKAVQYFSVWDKKSLEKNQKPFLQVIAPKTLFQHGEKARFYIYTAVPDALVYIFVQNGQKKTETYAKNARSGLLVYEVQVPEDTSVTHLQVSFQVVAFNDVQTQRFDLPIVPEQSPLTIETSTFRNKMKPGTQEKWTLRIQGGEKEKINAEVLASMYDMSLDQFAANRWSWSGFARPQYFSDYALGNTLAQVYYSPRLPYTETKEVQMPEMRWLDRNTFGGKIMVRGLANVQMKMETAAPQAELYEQSGDAAASADMQESTTDDNTTEKIPVRENLNETAFFYPQLYTDEEGNVSFEFTSPEALTRWKMLVLAHTADARGTVLEKETVTQKDFSVIPNYPRFLREGDEIQLQSKLSNLTDKKLSGTVQLQILDALSNEEISPKFAVSGNGFSQYFNINAQGNTVAAWKIKVPKNLSSAVLFRITAKAGSYSDGEQKAVAILPNRMLVTDALPVFVKEGQTRTFVLDHLKNSSSATLENVSSTLELSTNPVWKVIFALPSLKNDQNLSADVVFNKWFADVLASEIFKANPKMKAVFEEYQNKDLLKSNMEKNQELKQLLLEETPWVLESHNETEQMEKIARLFDVNTMRNSIGNDWQELQQLQNPDGGFSWYAGYPSSYSTSLYILKNLGKINLWLKGNMMAYQPDLQKKMIRKLIAFVDAQAGFYWNADQESVWSDPVFDYLDSRQYWEKDYPLTGKGKTLKQKLIVQASKADIKDFTFFGLHRAALLFDGYGLKDVSEKLIRYMKETSVQSTTQGVYWKKNLDEWGWYGSKVMNQAGALEAFEKITPSDADFIEEMKIWLITQKEVGSWGNSRATAEVIFTVLNSGKSWTSEASENTDVRWGGKNIEPQTKATGYLKQTVLSNTIDRSLATVTITKKGPGMVQGGLFWQYYEDLDSIPSSETDISVTKELYRKIKTENGEQLIKISADAPLTTGDIVTVRMILNTDRNMQFVHLKDMRAAGFEPLEAVSGYQWKNGLGYYQSVKDASVNFYIESLRKGKYVFEYSYVCNAAGIFSNGITTLQNYYAPQMNAHTQGTTVEILEK